MERREFLISVAILASAMRQGMAQQNAKMKRVAMLNPAVKAADMRIGGDPTYAIIFEEMKRLGYVDGVNMFLKPREFVGLFGGAVASWPLAASAHAKVSSALTRPALVFAGSAACFAVGKPVHRSLENGHCVASLGIRHSRYIDIELKRGIIFVNEVASLKNVIVNIDDL